MTTASAYEPMSTDDRISAAVKALMAARGVKTERLAAAIGVSRNQTFAKLRGASTWKASEVEAIADVFNVAIGDIYAGMGLLNNDEAPRLVGRRASTSGAPSGTRTPDPLIQSLRPDAETSSRSTSPPGGGLSHEDPRDYP